MCEACNSHSKKPDIVYGCASLGHGLQRSHVVKGIDKDMQSYKQQAEKALAEPPFLKQVSSSRVSRF